MSRVFLAEERAVGRRIVVKVLSPDLAAGVSAERFKREIMITAQLCSISIFESFLLLSALRISCL